MNKEMILSLAEQHFGNKYAKKYRFFYGPTIPVGRLQAARQIYAAFNPREEAPIFLYDDSAFGTGKKGFTLTNARFYYHLDHNHEFFTSKSTGSMSYSDIHHFKILVKFSHSIVTV